MPVAVIIIEISHEEIRHDFLLYQAENHTIIVVTPALEEGTKTFHPQFSNGSNIVIRPSTFIVPVFSYEVGKPFTQNTGATSPNINDFPSRCANICFASALENILESLRKPPKISGSLKDPQKNRQVKCPASNNLAGFLFLF